MIIKKFNAIFHRHSRWLFGLFTIIIIISFIGFMVPGSFFGFTPNGSSSTVGTAFGSKVTFEDLREINRNLQICGSLGFPVGDTKIEQQFVFFCMLKEAERLGIAASDKEVAQALQLHPMFQTKGKFDMAKYRQMVERMEKGGVSKTDMENSLRMLLVIDKLQNHMNAGTVVTPGEAEELFRQYNTTYEVKIAETVVAPAARLAKPQTRNIADLDKKEAAEVQKYYNANRNLYNMPGSMDVMVVEFKNAAFAAQAAKAATPAEVQKFYNSNKTLFTGKDGKVIPFKNAAAKAKAELIKAECAEMAYRAAEDFTLSAGEAVQEAAKSADRAKAFRDAASKLKLTVVEAQKVPFDGTMIGSSINSPALIREFVNLAGNPVTKAVPSAEGAYVGYLRSKIDPRPATLAEVLPQVRSEYAASVVNAAARKSTEAKYTAIKKLPAAQQLKAFNALTGVKFRTEKFTLTRPIMDPQLQNALMGALSMKPGDITMIAPRLQIVCLVSRKAPDYKEFKGKESQYMMIVRMRKQQQSGMAFMEYLNANCRIDPAITGAGR